MSKTRSFLSPSVAAFALILSLANAQADLDPAARDFLKSNCYPCHDAAKQKGKLRLDDLSTDFTNPQIAEKWSEVAAKLTAGEMPPKEETQPAAKEVDRFVEYLTSQIRDGAAARMARRGPVQHDRLSRREYAHTVYDFLGVVFDVEAPGAFHEDPLWHGFDHIGALLATSPSHLDRYLGAADAVIDLAFPDQETASKTVRKSAGDGKRHLLQLGEGWGAVDIRVPGRYRIKVRASGLPAFTGRRPRLSLWHDRHKKPFAGIELSTPDPDPETIEIEGLFPAGHYHLRNHGRSQDHPNGSYKLFRNETVDATTPLAALQGGFLASRTKLVDEQGRPVMPLLLIDWVEVEGPLTTEAIQARRAGLMPRKENDPAELRACLRRFAELAWRRPVADAELERYEKLVATEQSAGESFRAACRSALAGMLVARSFFNLEAGSPGENRARLNPHELASRLSYFLWSSMPDERLFDAARAGELTNREKLAREFNRMIADPKFDRFLDSFPRQWLQLHRVGMFQPDPDLYPDYDPWLQDSMVMETIASFTELFRRNLPLREAVDSNWTVLNSRLAIHYRLPPPATNGFVRVEMPPASGRGGLLTHASVLSLTSDGTRHRPVHRGAWLSEAILAHTPPPPPPNVNPIEPITGNRPKTTIRSQLKSHATDRTCISCHARIDPLGLAFENFDAIGRWRDTERVRGGIGADPVVDASGELPDGRRFANAVEFKRLLAADSRLAEAYVEQLATYALRRILTVDDRDLVRAIVQATRTDEHRIQSLVRALVLSELFSRR